MVALRYRATCPSSPKGSVAMTWPQVFVSYAHDSQPHKREVRRLRELLAKSGIDIRVDCWAASERRDWQVWATTQILEADFVIIASPECIPCQTSRDDSRLAKTRMISAAAGIWSCRWSRAGHAGPFAHPAGSVSGGGTPEACLTKNSALRYRWVHVKHRSPRRGCAARCLAEASDRSKAPRHCAAQAIIADELGMDLVLGLQRLYAELLTEHGA